MNAKSEMTSGQIPHPKPHTPAPDRGETWIGIFKLVKAALFFALAIGALSVLHKDVQEVVAYRMSQLGIDPDSRYLDALLRQLGFATTKKVELFSIGSFLYAGLFGTEGVGLLLHKRWALYVTVVITASFLPFEVYELARQFTIFRTLVILLNIFFVVYLIRRIKITSKGDKRK
jgi:uncharacterized membrane protein (DUF2068 family)